MAIQMTVINSVPFKYYKQVSPVDQACKSTEQSTETVN